MTTTTGIGVHDQNLERQIEKHMGGCMAGFFNLFDRSHLLSGKRLYPKRLPPPLPSSVVSDSTSEPVSAVGSPACSREFKKSQPPTPAPELRSPVIGDPPKSPLAVSTFEFKEAVKSPWKFSREAPRLSLDSRAVVDAKGGLHPREIRINTAVPSGDGDEERENQRRSPSVIARLMGLEPLPRSTGSVSQQEIKKVELRRSASESRSRDYRFFDAPSFLSPKTEIVGLGERKSDHFGNNQYPNCNTNAVNLNSVCNSKAKNQNQSNNRSINHRRMTVERRSYYDTADFFPPEKYQHHQQQQHQAMTIYGEIEKRLRMRGIDEPSKDLETLKNILEALQLKGLLHSSTAGKPRRNIAGDRRLEESFESPIVLMKPTRTPPPASRRNVKPSVSPRRDRPAARSPSRADNRSSAPAVRRRGGPLSIETQRRGGETTTLRGSSQSPAQSPRTRRSSSDQTVNRSPRSRRSTAEIERVGVLSGPEDEAEASTISESSSHTDNERWRVEEYREGRNLLERCDKLLHSIASMTSNSNSNSNSNSVELEKPSPVSVLDSSFYKEDESSPSPVKKRTIDFKDHGVMELEDEEWSPSSSRSQLLSLQHPDHHHHHHQEDTDSISDDSDFSYISEVLRASMYLPQEKTDLFLLLEKKQGLIRGGKDKSKASILQRRLIFDTITEILDRTRRLPPWKVVSGLGSSLGQPTLGQIWAEFRKIQERGPSEDLLEVVCGELKKDLAGDSVNGWGDCHVEVSEGILDIERLIFKDLITETIRDLASFAGKSPAPRRKLVF